MPRLSSPKTFAKIKARMRDLYRNHGHEIERGQFVPQVNSIVFKELKWLVDQIDFLTGETTTPPLSLMVDRQEAPAEVAIHREPVVEEDLLPEEETEQDQVPAG